MRLWHKQLIPVLPKQQLVAQWRELSAIVGAINKNGTPNHLLVNKVLDYDKSHLGTYSLMIKKEMENRGYKINDSVLSKILCYTGKESVDATELYRDWHDIEYLIICYYNLKEKYMCGGISKIEWDKIKDMKGIRLKEF